MIKNLTKLAEMIVDLVKNKDLVTVSQGDQLNSICRKIIKDGNIQGLKEKLRSFIVRLQYWSPIICREDKNSDFKELVSLVRDALNFHRTDGFRVNDASGRLGLGIDLLKSDIENLEKHYGEEATNEILESIMMKKMNFWEDAKIEKSIHKSRKKKMKEMKTKYIYINKEKRRFLFSIFELNEEWKKNFKGKINNKYVHRSINEKQLGVDIEISLSDVIEYIEMNFNINFDKVDYASIFKKIIAGDFTHLDPFLTSKVANKTEEGVLEFPTDEKVEEESQTQPHSSSVIENERKEEGKNIEEEEKVEKLRDVKVYTRKIVHSAVNKKSSNKLNYSILSKSNYSESTEINSSCSCSCYNFDDCN